MSNFYFTDEVSIATKYSKCQATNNQANLKAIGNKGKHNFSFTTRDINLHEPLLSSMNFNFFIIYCCCPPLVVWNGEK